MTSTAAEVEPSFRLGTRPALDGIRALSILLVMVDHTLLYLDLGYHAGSSALFQGAALGVDMFFVLSGFLITSLLLEERNRTGRLSFGRFYARRALRLLPALFAMLALFAIYAVVDPPGPAGTIVSAIGHILSYTADFFAGRDRFLTYWFGQTWSLAIEEQFYIVWPLTLIGLIALCRNRPRALATCLGLGLVGFSLWRVLLLHHYNSLWYDVYPRPDARFDELLAGALLAVVLHYGLLKDRPRPPLAFVGLGILGVLVQVASPYRPGYFQWGLPLAIVAGLALILGVIHAEGPVAGLLASRPARWLGQISYELYLVHVSIFGAIAVYFGTRHGLTIAKVILANALAFGVATTIHRFVGRPALRFKERFASSRLPARALD